jgi:hypothetical protein
VIRLVKRVAAGLLFAPLGFVSLVMADRLGQWLCAHVVGCRQAVNPCPIDVCAGDARLNMLRVVVWIGPAVVFGTSAFLFSGRQRPLGAWLVLLTALVIAHTLIMTALP